MADTDTQQTGTGAQQGEPHGEPGAQEPDTAAQLADLSARYERLLRESRKWEDRSKANKDAADKAAKLEASARTDAQRIADLETRVSAYEAQEKRAQLVRQVAEATGVPAGTVALLAGDDEDTLTQAAKAVAAWSESRPHSDPVKLGNEPKDAAGVSEERKALRALRRAVGWDR